MKQIDTDGITYMEPVPGGTAEWYFGLSFEHGDLYEAEQLFRHGDAVEGRTLLLIHYPDGELFRPLPKAAGTYSEAPVYLDGGIYMLNVLFADGLIRILRFDCASRETELTAELPLNAVRDCYNLRLHVSPLTLTRQGGAGGSFDIVWPEQESFPLQAHESFFLRDGDRLYFSKWHEEGEGRNYRYWEETAVRDLQGRLLETLPGDLRLMPDGEIWHLR